MSDQYAISRTMTGFFIIFMTIILCLAILLMIAVVSRDGDDERNNAPFISEDGDHEYYDRRLIEVKKSRRHHPEANDPETSRRLGRRPKDKI